MTASRIRSMIDTEYTPITSRQARAASSVWLTLVVVAFTAFLLLPFDGRTGAVVTIVVAGSFAAWAGGRLWDYADRLDQAETTRRSR